MTGSESCPISISLVIPVYNGAGFIKENLLKAAEFLKGMNGPNEIIVVDDCSTDGTGRMLETLTLDVEGISFLLLRNDQNRGKGYSVRRGMRVAHGKHLVFNDADFTYPVEEVGKFADHLRNGLDVVIGSRLHPDSQYQISPAFIPYLYTRHVTSRIFNLIVNLALHLKIKDTQAGIKGVSREAAQKIFERQSLNRFSFDLEMLFIAKRLGYRIVEVPVCFHYRKEPTTIKFFRDSMTMLYDIMRIRWRSLRGRYK